MLVLKTFLSTAILSGLSLGAPAVADQPQPDRVQDALEPRNTPLPPPKAFGLLAVAPGAPFDQAQMSASRGGLVLQLPNHEAKCGPKSDQSRPHAAFTLRGDGEWFLWDPKTGSKRQQMWSDVSGMGQGVLKYTKDENEAKHLNKNRITTTDFGFQGAGTPEKPTYLTWRVDTEFVACQIGDNKNGAWSVWLNAGVQKPGGNKKCRPFRAQVIQLPDALGCSYTNN